MSKRHKMSRDGSKKLFSSTASHTHIRNMPNGRPMRGGIRL